MSYAQTFHTEGPGGAVTFRVVLPLALAAGATATAQTALRRIADAAAQALTEAAQATFTWPAAQGAFRPITELGSGFVRAATITDDQIISFVKFGTRPHWAPWQPGSALARWADARGIPPFLVARKIARYGTPGRVDHILQTVAPRFQAALEAWGTQVLGT